MTDSRSSRSTRPMLAARRMMFRVPMVCGLTIPAFLTFGPPMALGADAAVATASAVAPEDAADREGERCTVIMKVSSSRLMEDTGSCFLNSQEDHRDEKNFTVVIFRRGLEDFSQAGIKDPAEHFLDKTIRVTGKVELHKDKPQIKVDRIDQIELVPESTAGTPQD